jgi:hypothetical protein
VKAIQELQKLQISIESGNTAHLPLTVKAIEKHRCTAARRFQRRRTITKFDFNLSDITPITQIGNTAQ